MKNIIENQEAKISDKLTEKAFSRFMLISVLSVLMCIVCLCSATWAWFTTDTISDSNIVSSGNLDIEVTVTDGDTSGVTLTEKPDGTTVCTFATAGSYEVVLKLTDDTTVSKGYCSIKVGDRIYRTDAIYLEDRNYTFTIEIGSDETVAIFDSNWGLPAHVDVVDGKLVIEVAPGA